MHDQSILWREQRPRPLWFNFVGALALVTVCAGWIGGRSYAQTRDDKALLELRMRQIRKIEARKVKLQLEAGAQRSAPCFGRADGKLLRLSKRNARQILYCFKETLIAIDRHDAAGQLVRRDLYNVGRVQIRLFYEDGRVANSRYRLSDGRWKNVRAGILPPIPRGLVQY